MLCQQYTQHRSSAGMMYTPNKSRRKRIGRCRINIIYRVVTVMIGICCCIKGVSSFSIQHYPSRWTTNRRRSTNLLTVVRWHTSSLHQSSSKGTSSSSDNRQVKKAPVKGELVKHQQRIKANANIKRVLTANAHKRDIIMAAVEPQECLK